MFEGLDGVLIRHTILRMDGAAGPSGLDVAAWKKLRTSFRGASDSLCAALAAVCHFFVDSAGLAAFLLPAVLLLE